MNQSIVDISHVNMEELIRDMEEEKVTRLLKQIMENNVILLNLQKQILELQVVKDKKRIGDSKKENREEENIMRGGKRKKRKE